MVKRRAAKLGPSSRMTGGQASPLTREVDAGPLARSQGLLTVTVPGELGEHSEEEWYPPTPPIYDVTDKLRYAYNAMLAHI